MPVSVYGRPAGLGFWVDCFLGRTPEGKKFKSLKELLLTKGYSIDNSSSSPSVMSMYAGKCKL